tara:strand:+ start:396 stop:698 length:303 start_codon:yes stop_codon:yes gene_type:complete
MENQITEVSVIGVRELFKELAREITSKVIYDKHWIKRDNRIRAETLQELEQRFDEKLRLMNRSLFRDDDLGEEYTCEEESCRSVYGGDYNGGLCYKCWVK